MQGQAQPPTGAAAPTGCCTIHIENVIPDRQIPNVTRDQCEAIAAGIPGAVAHWDPGDCAQC
jgi:hypothetical protein